MKTKDEVVIELRVLIARKYRTQGEAARAWGVLAAFVSAVMCGEKLPTEVMLRDAGYKKVQPEAYYVRIKKEK